MNEDKIVRSSASGRTIILVSGEVQFIQKCAVITPSEGVKVKRPLVASENLTYNQPQLGNGGKLVLITNRKSHMGFQLVSKLVTLNNLERCNGQYYANSEKRLRDRD